MQETKAHEEAKQIKEAKWKVKVALMAKLRRKQKAQQAALRKKAEVLDAQIKVQAYSKQQSMMASSLKTESCEALH